MRQMVINGLVLAALLATLPSAAKAADKIRLGVQTALTGDAAAFGVDIKNALTLINDELGQGRYQLVFEDERCENKSAIAAAQKLINIDQVRYALGFPCNSTLFVTAPLYERAGVTVITSSATSGDRLDLGRGIFRLFPSDAGAAVALYEYIAPRHKSLVILTEQNEYPLMMQRVIASRNSAAPSPLRIVSEEFTLDNSDLRTIILKLRSVSSEAIFMNTNTETSMISAIKQLRTIGYPGTVYAAYFPASAVAQRELGSNLEGVVFVNLPVSEELSSAKGKELLLKYRARFGDPLSGVPVVPMTFEAFRALDLAIRSGRHPVDYLASTTFDDGYIAKYHFDRHGAVQGINFEMQKIINGAVVQVAD